MPTDHEIKRGQAVTEFVQNEAVRAALIGSQYPGKPLHRHAYVAEHIKLQAARIAELEAACQLRLDDWSSVTQPGAACEGCDDPEDVAAIRKAMRPTQ